MNTVGPAPSMPVIGALNALDKSASDVHANLDDLERRLEAVLRPPLPETTAPAPAPTGYAPRAEPPIAQSRVTQEVMASASTMERASNRIAALMSRLEV